MKSTAEQSSESKVSAQIEAEYDAVRNRAGLIDLSANGRIRVGGSEAVMFLNGLVTNDMKTLAENHWMPAVFPTVQGRLIAVTRIVRLGDDLSGKNPSPNFLLETEAATHEALLKTIERFTLAGDFRVIDVTADKGKLTVQGPRAAAIIASTFGAAIGDLSRDGAVETSWNETRLTIIRATHTGEDGFDLIFEIGHAPSISSLLIGAGATPVGQDALEVLRIEAGIPRFGQDMNETNVVPEVNLDEAVSYTKGCYIGQEIIVRIKHRGHVAKQLSGLKLESEETVLPGAVIKSVDGAEVGRVTSSAFSPTLRTGIALGYVRYEHAAIDTTLRVITEAGETTARVTALPFVRGSFGR